MGERIKMECKCEHLSTMKNNKDCKCNVCGRIWGLKDGKWFVLPCQDETGEKNEK